MIQMCVPVSKSHKPKLYNLQPCITGSSKCKRYQLLWHRCWTTCKQITFTYHYKTYNV